MEIEKGSVVKATAGRDKNDIFVVIAIDCEYAIICNGKRRPLEKPKRKKLKHLSLTKMVVAEKSMSTNREIRKTLNQIKEFKDKVPQ